MQFFSVFPEPAVTRSEPMNIYHWPGRLSGQLSMWRWFYCRIGPCSTPFASSHGAKLSSYLSCEMRGLAQVFVECRRHALIFLCLGME